MHLSAKWCYNALYLKAKGPLCHAGKTTKLTELSRVWHKVLSSTELTTVTMTAVPFCTKTSGKTIWMRVVILLIHHDLNEMMPKMLAMWMKKASRDSKKFKSTFFYFFLFFFWLSLYLLNGECWQFEMQKNVVFHKEKTGFPLYILKQTSAFSLYLWRSWSGSSWISPQGTSRTSRWSDPASMGLWKPAWLTLSPSLMTQLLVKGKPVNVVYLDFSKTCDTDSHSILLGNLDVYGLDGCPISPQGWSQWVLVLLPVCIHVQDCPGPDAAPCT